MEIIIKYITEEKETVVVAQSPILYFNIVSHKKTGFEDYSCVRPILIDIMKITQEDVIVDKNGDGYDNSISRIKNNIYGFSYNYDTGYMEFNDIFHAPFNSTIQFSWDNNTLTFYNCKCDDNKVHFDYWEETLTNKNTN